MIKIILTYVALGWTRISMDKMFSELQGLGKRVFNVKNVSPIHIKLICVLIICKLSSQRRFRRRKQQI